MKYLADEGIRFLHRGSGNTGFQQCRPQIPEPPPRQLDCFLSHISLGRDDKSPFNEGDENHSYIFSEGASVQVVHTRIRRYRNKGFGYSCVYLCTYAFK